MIKIFIFLSRSACDSLPAAEPVPLPFHAQSSVPSFYQASRLPRRWNHACQGEEAAQPGWNARHQPGTKPWIPKNGQSSSPF